MQIYEGASKRNKVEYIKYSDSLTKRTDLSTAIDYASCSDKNSNLDHYHNELL